MKRHKSLFLLLSNHHHGLRIAKKLQPAKSFTDSEAKDLINEFSLFYRSQLLGHFDDEEKNNFLLY